MNKITSPLNPNSFGQPLLDLQDALLEFLQRDFFGVDEQQKKFFKNTLLAERSAGRYNDITLKLVGEFQERRHLPTSGWVDEQTAQEMNALLAEWGLLTPATEPVAIRRVVGGRVSRTDGQAFTGALVRAFQENTGVIIRLGEDRTDAEGRYTIRYELLPGTVAANLRVAVLDDAGQTLQSSGLIEGAGELAIADLSVPDIEPAAPAQQLDGRVFFDHGLPAAGVTLRLYRLGFGGAQSAEQVGEAVTREHGLYNFSYTPGAGSSNLELRAVAADGNEIPLSGAILRAGKREIVNVVAPSTIQPLAAEFTRMSADLTPHVGGAIEALALAQENAERADLTLLNESTGWDARLIALASTAQRLSAAEETGLPADVLYGALRAGLPADKEQLAQVSPAAFGQGLDKARSAGIIQMDDDQFAAAKASFENFSVNTRLSFQTPGSLATYDTLLQQTGLSTEEQSAFAQLYFKHEGNSEKLWTEMTNSGMAAAVPVLQRQGKMAYLTTNNPDLMMKVEAQLAGQAPSALADMQYYEKAKWMDLIEKVPPVYDTKESYAEDLARRVRISYATEVTWNMIRTGEMDVSGLGSASTIQLLLKNAIDQGFKLGQTQVDPFLKEHPAVFDGIEADQQKTAAEALKALHRVYQITPGNDAMKVLLGAGLFSAQDVLAYPLDVFLERFGEALGVDQATLVYRKCEQVGNVATSLFTLSKELDSAPALFALSPAPEVRQEAKQNLIKTYPSIESLFGPQDFCECEHCRSVLSPAAYLVDLLQFLDTEPKVWENSMKTWKQRHGNAPYPFRNETDFNDFKTRWQAAHPGDPLPSTELIPYDVLIERRPDIAHIPLTCENTNTVMPQIDLVNEIMEYYVAHQTLSADTARDTGEASTEELLAEPQFIEPDAYKTLLAARYPLHAPFDLWLETARPFCAYFDTPLWRLLDTFCPSDALFAPTQSYDRAAVFIESLGISLAELDIFTNPDPLAAWFELYGFDSEEKAITPAIDDATQQRTDLNSAKVLSRRLGVTYKELVEIARSSFVNPRLNELTVLHKLGLSIDDVLHYKNNRADYEQNEDLLDKKRANLPPADQARYDALTKADWNRLQEAAAIVAKLKFEARAFPGFDAVDWLHTAIDNNDFDRVLILADPLTGSGFDQTTLKYANGDDADSFIFLKINLFVRLWRKTGWSIGDADLALQVFMPKNAPFEPANFARQPLLTALIYMAHLKALDEQANAGKNSRQKWLTLWNDLPTTGKNPLYAQLFLTRGVLRNDPVFDHPLGQYLDQGGLFVQDHTLALQGALGLSAEEIAQILNDAGLAPESAPLTLPIVSLLYRHVLLAKAAKLSIGDLIALRQLSGIDPFKPLHPDPLDTLEHDYPFSQTLRFIELAALVKQSGFKMQDLNYLVRHQYDPTGKLHPDAAEMMALTKTLATGIRAIQNEHTAPEDPAALSDDALRQKLGLVLPPDVVARLFAMLDGINDVTVTQAGILPANQLRPDIFGREPAIQKVVYNETRQEQTAVLRGVLTDAQKSALKTKFDPGLNAGQEAVFSALLDAAQTEAKDFFVKHLQRQIISPGSNSGFLEAGDYDKLFEPTPVIPEGLTAVQKKAAEKANEENRRAKRALLIHAFLPYLQNQLIRQLVVQTISAEMETAAGLIESLLTDPLLMSDPMAPGHSLLAAFQATATQGISASFFADATLSGASTRLTFGEADTGLRDAGGNLLRPANAKSARFEGCFEVSKTGAYRFYAVLDQKNTIATLQFDHLPNPVFSGVAAHDGDTLGKGAAEFVELKAGVPYRFTLSLQDMGGGDARLLVQGEQLPTDDLSRLTLYPAEAVRRSVGARILLGKALHLIQTLGLNERELRYILAHAPDFGGASLSALPTTTESVTPASTVHTFSWLTRLIAYTELKNDMADGGTGLIGVFDTFSNDPDAGYATIASLLRRDKTTVQATAGALFATPVFSDELTMGRLWQALKMTTSLGVPLREIVKWTKIVDKTATQDERYKIARNLKESLKARFEPETWLRVAQPIFDKLRQRQRDALVAFILHRKGFERIEQLFEYFLIDPGAEPAVQTSRIRAAIGSVQVFIQRCLLNMEPQVAASAIHSKQWQWMNRYRVWEANRKIFLYPENWLEPEFRDDKTHLFAELEGALLQGDVSADLVEDAFFKYLRKLDALARLDIAGMYCEEDAFDPASNTLHVIGRTFAQPHQYFYRRYKHQMWTPWEPVTAEIQGNHLVPVVWRDRLNLFWVTFLEKADPNGVPASGSSGSYSQSVSATLNESGMKAVAIIEKTGSVKGSGSSSKSGKPIAEMSPAELSRSIQNAAKNKIIDLQLHWSEYFNGEWSARESGGFTASMSVLVSLDFNPDSTFVHVTKEYEDGEERAVKIHLGSPVNRTFRVVSRNSMPESDAFEAAPQNPYNAPGIQANRRTGNGAFKVTYRARIETEDGKGTKVTTLTPDILRDGGAFTLLPCANAVNIVNAEIGALVAPVFYHDNHGNTFFVEPSFREKTIEEWQEWVRKRTETDTERDKPDYWGKIELAPQMPLYRVPAPIDTNDALWNLGPDPRSKVGFAQTNDWLVNQITVIHHNGEFVGSTGKVGLAMLSNKASAGLRTAMQINPGSAVAENNVVIAADEGALAGNDLVQATGMLNVVGSSGLNAALVDQVNSFHTNLNAGNFNLNSFNR